MPIGFCCLVLYTSLFTQKVANNTTVHTKRENKRQEKNIRHKEAMSRSDVGAYLERLVGHGVDVVSTVAAVVAIVERENQQCR